MGNILLRDNAMYDSKRCFKCNINQPLTKFYKHKQMADGHLNKCIECTKKDTKENTAKNIEYYREYDQQRANLPKRVYARLMYSQTEEGKKALKKAKEKWIAENVVKRAAQIIVGNAIRAGKITKMSNCSECGKAGKIHGHHDDYAYPLSVRWLCPICHTKWHKINGEGKV